MSYLVEQLTRCDLLRLILLTEHPDRHPGHADPHPADPDRYQFQANEKIDKLNFCPEKFRYAVQNTENYDILL